MILQDCYRYSYKNEAKIIKELDIILTKFRICKKKCPYKHLPLANLLLKIIMNNFGIAALCENPQNMISEQDLGTI